MKVAKKPHGPKMYAALRLPARSPRRRVKCGGIPGDSSGERRGRRRSLCLFPPTLLIPGYCSPRKQAFDRGRHPEQRDHAPLRATSISPTGNPPARGSGSEIAQRSKKLAIARLRRTSAFLAVKPSLLETSAIVGATIASSATPARRDRTDGHPSRALGSSGLTAERSRWSNGPSRARAVDRPRLAQA